MYSIQFPEQLDEATFLRDYWQIRPLYMPGAWPNFDNPLSAEELAGLALDEAFPSRIVEQHSAQRWSVRQGPFSEADFAALEGKRWSLLITDIEKHLPDFGRYTHPFRFIPDWRFDDLMISYAPPGGSVGPHFDDYDVFLIQAQGERTWKVEGEFRILPCPENELIADSELRLIKQFKTQETYLCKPGDMLYLPPRLGHFGVAESDCMTWSMGFKAPNFHELLIDYMHEFELANEHKRFTDPGISLQKNPGEITAGQIKQLKKWFIQQINESDEIFARWVAKYLSDVSAAGDFFSETEYVDKPGCDAIPIQLETNPFIRYEFIQLKDRTLLYAGGEEFEISLTLAKKLSSKLRMNLSQTTGKDRMQVLEMLKRGYILAVD
jgi:50S ribosomal protein L16 3-hydroxylase